MFDHVKFGVSDFAASKAFFLAALEPIGIAVGSEGTPSYGVELIAPMSKASLCLFQTDVKPAHLHLAFTAEDRHQVEAFYRVLGLVRSLPTSIEGTRPAEVPLRMRIFATAINMHETLAAKLTEMCSMPEEPPSQPTR